MYAVLELKMNPDGAFQVSTYKKDTRDEAEKAYYSILAVAATSNGITHGAVILNQECKLLKSDVYKHEPNEA